MHAAPTTLARSQQQPLPPYQRSDFAQSFDRTRPHELVDTFDKHGKLVDPKRLGDLQYRFLDTEETVTCPNVWYNQTREMRIGHWRWQVENADANLLRSKLELKMVEDARGDSWMGYPKSIALYRAQAEVNQYAERLAHIKQVLADVTAGTRFI